MATRSQRLKFAIQIQRQRANKALHPTAYSSVHFVRRSSSLHSLRFRRRVSLSLGRRAQLDVNYDKMFKALQQRWEREKQESIEGSRLFDVVEKNGQLLVVKRQKPVMSRVSASLIFTLIWCFITWQVFSSPINRNSWLPWGILWFCSVPLYWLLFEAREAWRVWKMGDVWIFDKKANTISRNGNLLAPLNAIKCVKAKESPDPEYGTILYLCLVPIQGKEIKIDYYGFAAHWSHLVDAAQQISNYSGLQLVQERVP